MTVEARLAGHIAALEFEALTPNALDATDLLLLDTIAAILSSVGNAECRAIVGRLVDGTPGPATVIGHAAGTNASLAALVNGILAHWTEWDDVHDRAGIHGSAVIFPALLAAAQKAGRVDGVEAGREFMAAAVAAYDVAARVGEVMNRHSFHGWMTTGAAVSIGAAGAAARLLGLDQAGILSAMGIAATGGGLSRQALADRTSGKNALCGMAAKIAVDAALMARAGIVGAPNWFAGAFGINQLHAGGKGDLEPLLADLGASFSVVDAGVKPYPSCRSTHPSIDIVLDLLAERPEIAGRVKSAVFTVPDLPFALCGRPYEPGSNPRVSAQFSIPFTAALALTRGMIRPKDFLPADVLAFLAEKRELIGNLVVELARNPPLGGQATTPSLARILLDDGEVIERGVDRIKGSPSRPMTAEDQWQKLVLAGDGVMTAEGIQGVRQAGMAVRSSGVGPLLTALRLAA